MAQPFLFWKGMESAAEVQQRFLPVVRNLSSAPLSVPPSLSIAVAAASDAPQLQRFLQENFAAAGCRQPRLVVELRPSDTEIVLQASAAADKNLLQETQPAGCIRFKTSGFFEGHPIHLIDAFCIHPTYRKKGLATALLTALHVETQARGHFYSLFLKEGALLPIAQKPLYSSTYAYCRTSDLPPHTLSVFQPSMTQVSACIRAYQALRPDTFVHWDLGNPNQTWRMWRDGHRWMLLCVQDAYQEIPSSSSSNPFERIGWMTALLESPALACNPFRATVLEALLQTTQYPWIWTDAQFIPYLSCSPAWKPDGPFHWYSYGWTTCLRPGSNYVFVV